MNKFMVEIRAEPSPDDEDTAEKLAWVIRSALEKANSEIKKYANWWSLEILED